MLASLTPCPLEPLRSAQREVSDPRSSGRTAPDRYGSRPARSYWSTKRARALRLAALNRKNRACERCRVRTDPDVSAARFRLYDMQIMDAGRINACQRLSKRAYFASGCRLRDKRDRLDGSSLQQRYRVFRRHHLRLARPPAVLKRACRSFRCFCQFAMAVSCRNE